jgi:hypothetical protein
MLDMYRAGASNREIGEAIGISHVAVGQWLEDANLEPNPSRGPRASRRRRMHEAIVGATGDQEVVVSSGGSQRPPEGRDALQVIKDRLAAVSETLTRVTPLFEAGTFDPGPYEKLLKLESFLAVQLAQLTPPDPEDPEKDPTNLEQADVVRGRLERLIADAERTSRCLHCGKPPFVRSA